MSTTAMRPISLPSMTTGTSSPGLKICRDRYPVWLGHAVNFDLAVHQVDDPVNGDSSQGVGQELFSLIAIQCGLRNFDQQRHVGRLGGPVLVVVVVPSHDRDVWLRLVIFGNPNRLLESPRPSWT